MSQGKVVNIGSKRTLLLLSLLLLVAFVVFLVTLLREPGPSEQQGKMAESDTPQMVRGQIHLPQPIEVSRPVALSTTPAAQEPAIESSSPSAAAEAPGSQEGELPKLAEKSPAAATKPTPPQEKLPRTAETRQPAQMANVQPTERPTPQSVSGPKYTIQVGAFSSKERAEKLASLLREGGFEATVQSTPTGGGRTYHRVMVGSFSEILEAKKMEVRLKARKDIGETLVKQIR